MRISELIMEGGHVFAGKTHPIKQENINPTLAVYFNELSRIFPKKSKIFNTSHFIMLGSTGKKTISGDIDLGISALDILDKTMSDASIKVWGINAGAVNNEALKLQARARTATPSQSRMKAFFKLLARYINAKSKLLYCNETQVSAWNIFGMMPQIDRNGNKLNINVQIDCNVGNLNWLKFSYYSDKYPATSNIKGLHRTQLLLAAFQVANLSFSHNVGIKDKVTGKIIATTPEQSLKILSSRLGFNISDNDTKNFYKLINLFKTHMKASDYEKLLQIYFKILDSTRCDIPDILQADWLKRKNQLGLTGKFLPDSSALKEKI
jgi:hypothetical protein